MSNIKFKTSKKTTIILLIVLFLIIGGTGGYLLWRVNQQDTVAPTDSSAGSDQADCCCREPINKCRRKCQYKCLEYKKECVEYQKCNRSVGYCEVRGGLPGMDCDEDSDCPCLKEEDSSECKRFAENPSNGPECTCTNEANCCEKVSQCKCTSGTQCPPCKWPLVAFCRSATGCTCIKYDEDDGFRPSERCDDTKPCVKCPEGYEMTSQTGPCKAGEIEKSGSCTCYPCQNPYTATICCKPKTQVDPCGNGQLDEGEGCDPPGSTCENGQICSDLCQCPTPPQPTCGDGIKNGNEECDPKDTTSTCPGGLKCTNQCTCPCDGIGKEGSITFTPSKTKTGGKIKYQYIMGDSKEIDLNSVTVLVNHGSLRVFYPKGIKVTGLPEGSNSPYKQARVEGELDSEIYKVGNNPVLIAWKRPGESTISSACQIRGNFVIEEETPTWGVEKSVVEECIDDGTENPSAKLRYTITITNKSTTAGTITSVVDTLDDKVVEGSVTDISDGGTYTHSDRTIRWGSFQIAAGQSKVLRYSITVSKDAFGIYDNVVVVKPSVGTDLVDNATITADCVIGETPQPPKEGGTVPDTGLFDESENIVVIGGILLFLGLGWTWLTKTYQIVNGKLVERSRERFEQRVVKK